MRAALPRRKTKIVCTLGPATCTPEGIAMLAGAGMNVARLNMSHGDHTWHREVMENIKAFNRANPDSVIGILLDTKGPEVRSGDVKEPLLLETGDKLKFICCGGTCDGTNNELNVNYDGFVHDVAVGDVILVDGGIMSFRVDSKTDSEVLCTTVDGGKMGGRRHLNVRNKSASLPSITEKDWDDIRFGVENEVDFFALSFVKDGDVVRQLKAWLREQGSQIQVLSKVESAESVTNLESILDESDGAMVARGDLGAELPVEKVPYWQSQIVQGCRKRGKPVIVATNMLESMIDHPKPTRAEVSDISIAAREGTDAVMLSGETAYGKFPTKAIGVMHTVSQRTEAAMRAMVGARRYGSDEAKPITWIQSPGDSAPSISEMFAFHATTMANTLDCPILVFSRNGNMPALLSHYRPNNFIFCFTDNPLVQRRLTLYQGVHALSIVLEDDADRTIDKALGHLVARRLIPPGQQVAIVRGGRKPIWRSNATHAIQVRVAPEIKTTRGGQTEVKVPAARTVDPSLVFQSADEDDV